MVINTECSNQCIEIHCTRVEYQDFEIIELGCLDPNDCNTTKCSYNCIECDLHVCRACLYGYFLFNTPEYEVVCVPCPGYLSVDIKIKYSCATCLEMPSIWQQQRRCDFKYEFSDNPPGLKNNLLNYTTEVYPIYMILYL